MSAAPSEGRYLVTGASGFLGRHLLETLQRGAVPRRSLALVRDLDAWGRWDWTRKLDRVETLRGSVTEPATWRGDPRLEGLRGIFHLAAVVRHSRHRPEELYRTNVEGTRNLVRLAAARKCRLIFVSSSGTVGCFRTPEASADEHAPFCEEEVSRWPYYRSKIRAEQEARHLAGELGVKLVILRPPVLLGPGDHRFRSTSTLLRFLRRKLPFLIRGGMHFADVRDAVEATLRAMEREPVRPVYHLPGTVCSVEEFFELTQEVSGVPAPRLTLPFRPAWLLAAALERLGVLFSGEPLHVLPDPVILEMASRHWAVHSRYAERELDYAPRPARETLADTIDWLRDQQPALL